ncbi:hypothetical protein HK097_001285 [Rhizophlyctis rosea]|uniref:Uncharacterized protein n=1 Tax=Rhizophlyctis rosea TaxID=64517 RepID=A0AAD5X4F5_9FUNG|nr:hypothetical protein HK097_001285 [Rhizophlyctis rosea]
MATIASRATEAAVQVSNTAVQILDPFLPQAAKDAATSAKDYTVRTVGAATEYATAKYNQTYEWGKVIVQGATTTVETYTPGPILSLVHGALDGAKHLREDPVGTVKPYVPTFVIQSGEKTFEIVHDANNKTREVASSTTGYIVEKVNGTVQSVTSIPQVAHLIDQLDQITKGSLTKLGVKPTTAGGAGSSDAAAPAPEMSYAAAVKE